jgi:hypothetical protein
LSNLIARTVNCDCGVGGLVRIDADQNHGLPALCSLGRDVRGGHPDFKSICLHASVEPHRTGARRPGTLSMSQPERRQGAVRTSAVWHPGTLRDPKIPAVSAVNSTSQGPARSAVSNFPIG